MATAYISLGCNVGDCRANLTAALRKLDSCPQLSVIAVSSVYITEPVGGIEQPSFLNLAAALETELAPQELLLPCRLIGYDLGGRSVREPRGPRPMDRAIIR